MKTSRKWMFFVLPASITAEGLHIVIPLYVLFLGGNVVDVGIVVGLHYALSAIGAIFWGKVMDKYHIKKGILLICFSAITICSIILYFTVDLSIVFVLSSVAGFFIIGKNPVTQILVMESVPNNQWSKLFSQISIITSFGSLIAFLVGSMWDTFFDLSPYFLFCAIVSAAAIILSLSVGSKSTIERHTLVQSIHGIKHIFDHTRLNFQFIFIKIPHPHDFKPIISIFQGKISHEIGILFLANFLFYFGSNIFFTAFIPFLKKFDFTNSQVFLVYMIQTMVLLVIFFFVPKLIAKISEERAIQMSYLPRVLGIIIAAILIPIAIGMNSFVFAVISSCLMVSAFSIFSVSNSVIIFKSIPKGFEGTYLGVNSFMTGVGIFLGALTAGYVSNMISYSASFILAVCIIISSLVVFKIYLKYRLSHKVI
ncbi:MAG: MFS transporter [Nitrosarchaeum sp.]|nr:MAG: MFS transporter [Nitrosarchaeum sp.]